MIPHHWNYWLNIAGQVAVGLFSLAIVVLTVVAISNIPGTP